jgi:hypothetical protein
VHDGDQNGQDNQDHFLGMGALTFAESTLRLNAENVTAPEHLFVCEKLTALIHLKYERVFYFLVRVILPDSCFNIM